MSGISFTKSPDPSPPRNAYQKTHPQKAELAATNSRKLWFSGNSPKMTSFHTSTGSDYGKNECIHIFAVYTGGDESQRNAGLHLKNVNWDLSWIGKFSAIKPIMGIWLDTVEMHFEWFFAIGFCTGMGDTSKLHLLLFFTHMKIAWTTMHFSILGHPVFWVRYISLFPCPLQSHRKMQLSWILLVVLYHYQSLEGLKLWLLPVCALVECRINYPYWGWWSMMAIVWYTRYKEFRIRDDTTNRYIMIHPYSM